MKKIITIDGFASSGKSSLSRRLAKKMNWEWLSTGVIYRGIAYVVDKENLSKDKILPFIHSSQWKLELNSEKTVFFYKDKDITDKLYTLQVDDLSSLLSADALVREALIPLQRSFQSQQGLIAEGRDCGTQIFPEAPLKIFLQAKNEIRAKRRQKDRNSKEISLVLKAQTERDKRDKTRSFAPTLPASDSICINTEELLFRRNGGKGLPRGN